MNVLRLLAIALATLSLATASPDELLKKPDAWFRSGEGRETAAIVLSWQSPEGSWPKNKDTCRKPYPGPPEDLHGTFDNKATTGELRLLARAWRITGEDRCRDAVLKGFDHILEAQYHNGGWPQYFPPGKKYPRHITYNDGSMVRLLEFLRDSLRSDDFAFLDSKRRRAAGQAYQRGIACIVDCQVKVNGKATVWCAQHDEITLAPADARSYELASLSGSESAGILRFLMRVEKPSREVIRCIEAGVAWFEEAAIHGIRIDRSGGDCRVVPDRKAKPVWARFYDLGTGKPYFCDRDGIKKDKLSDIGKERRTGYAWYGNWGESVASDHAKWKKRHELR
ncbi:pectate lyase [Luteolibacter marinus]|uniref:pectate lyase n=1 Tax=Luteolibacter marinus TaxID=2776705 RepID=UPI0018660C96